MTPRRLASIVALATCACTQGRLDANPVPTTLTAELEREGLDGRSRVDSPALLRAIKAGRAALPELQAAAASPAPADRRLYLIAEAIREIDAAAFASLDGDRQLRVYVDALAHARTFNDWGMPGSDFGARGEWLLRFGGAASALLAPLLDDRRLAPLFGSQEATLAHALQNRVCDYALFFLLALRGERPAYPKDPAARDRMIAELKRALAGARK